MINNDPHDQLHSEQHRSFTQPSQYGSFIGREEYAKITNTIYKPLCRKTGNKARYYDHSGQNQTDQAASH